MTATDTMFLTRKATATGFVFQVNGRGRWLSERSADFALANGTYPVIERGVLVATWHQDTTGHTIR